MSEIQVAPKVSTADNVRIARYDVDALRERYPNWDDWPRHTRRRYCEHAADPESVERSSNVTCDALHEYYAAVLTFETGDGNRLDPPHEIAFGSDDTAFSTTDTTMNNEVGERITATDVSQTGKNTELDEYLSSNEQNGNTIKEIGVFSEGGEMYQHAPTSTTYNKDSSFALVINITISHSDA